MTTDEQEDDREAREEDVQGDLVRRLLTLRSLDEGDHAVEEAFARDCRDPHDDLIREHAGASGDGGAVAAGLPDDRRRLSGDGGFVDARDSLDHLAVGGDDLSRRDDDDVAEAELDARDVLERARSRAAVGDGGRACLAELVRLRLSAPLRDCFGEVREEHREPQPGCDEAGEDVLLPGRVREVLDEEDGDEDAADLHDEHHRVARHPPRVELREAVDRAPVSGSRGSSRDRG